MIRVRESGLEHWWDWKNKKQKTNPNWRYHRFKKFKTVFALFPAIFTLKMKLLLLWRASLKLPFFSSDVEGKLRPNLSEFRNSFQKYLLSTYEMPGNVLSIEDKVVINLLPRYDSQEDKSTCSTVCFPHVSNDSSILPGVQAKDQ